MRVWFFFLFRCIPIWLVCFFYFFCVSFQNIDMSIGIGIEFIWNVNLSDFFSRTQNKHLIQIDININIVQMNNKKIELIESIKACLICICIMYILIDRWVTFVQKKGVSKAAPNLTHHFFTFFVNLLRAQFSYLKCDTSQKYSIPNSEYYI